MKSQKILVILFFLLLVFAMLLFFSNKKSTLKSRISDFSIENIEQINKIIISKAENKISLEKEINNWRINGTYKARPAAISFFLNSLSRFEVRSPVSHKNQIRIINKLNTDSKKIEIYGNRKLLKSILVYHDTSGVEGTYMMLEQTQSPFLMKIKGYPGYNMDRLFPLNEQIWCDNTLFNYMPNDIGSIKIEYPDKPENSFQIIKPDRGKLSLKHPDSNQLINEFIYANVSDYLNFFTNIKFTFSHNPYSYKLKEDAPFVTISIKNNDNVTSVLKGYRKYSDKDTQVNSKYDIDCFYGLLNGGSKMIELKYVDFDPILKDINYFIKK